jgi:hypothetical protein
MTLRIALLADLSEPLSPEARGEPAVLGFELACGLARYAREIGEVEVDLFARRGSRTPLPLVSLDPGELLAEDGRTTAGGRERAAADEALLCQVALSGLLEGYQVVHCLTPAVTALQIAAAGGLAVVQTIPGRRSSPAARILPHLVTPKRLAQVVVAPRGIGGRRHVPAGVDLIRFQPADPSREEHLLWLGTGGAAGERTALAVAAALDLPLRTFKDGEVEPLLQHARALLHLAPVPSIWGSVWSLRALACGTPVAGWAGSGLEELAAEPVLGALAPRGDAGALVERLRALPSRRQVGAARRQVCLGRHGSRAMVARYREIYKELTAAA